MYLVVKTSGQVPCMRFVFPFWQHAKFWKTGRYPRPVVTFPKSGVLQFEGAPLLEDIDNPEAFGTKRERTKRIRALGQLGLGSNTMNLAGQLIQLTEPSRRLYWLGFDSTMQF